MLENDNKPKNKLLIAMRKADKKLNHYQANSGRFNFPRFTKLQNYLLESLYVMSDLNNPSAYRLYLYLIRNITGYEKKEDIQYDSKKMKADLNMGNSFYKAIEILKNKNLIDYVYDKYDRKYIELNVYPNLWKTKDKDKINVIVHRGM
jgi:hypothetical protein